MGQIWLGRKGPRASSAGDSRTTGPSFPKQPLNGRIMLSRLSVFLADMFPPWVNRNAAGADARTQRADATLARHPARYPLVFPDAGTPVGSERPYQQSACRTHRRTIRALSPPVRCARVRCGDRM